MRFGFIAKHREIWPVQWICEALGVSRAGFYARLTRSKRSRSDEELGARVRASFLASDRTYGARRVWHDLLAAGLACGLHRIERLMRLQGLRARPRRRRLPPDLGERQAGAVAPNVLDRAFQARAHRPADDAPRKQVEHDRHAGRVDEQNSGRALRVPFAGIMVSDGHSRSQAAMMTRI